MNQSSWYAGRVRSKDAPWVFPKGSPRNDNKDSNRTAWFGSYCTIFVPAHCGSGNSFDEITTVNKPDRFVFTWTDYRHGTKNPAWLKAVLSGTEATTPLTAFRRRFRRMSYGHSVTRTPCPIGWPPRAIIETFDGLFDARMPTASGASSSYALAQALRVLVRKASNAITPFQSGIFLGELHKTLHMIRHPAQSLLRLMRDYQRAVMKRTRGKPSFDAAKRVILDTYLEYTYGWRPFFMDVDNGMQALATYAAKNPFHVERFQAYGKDEVASNDTTQSALTSVNILTKWEHKSVEKARVAAGIRIYTDGSLCGSAWTFGLNTDQFLPTAWELLPYSFLIDYFTNIGTIVDAWSIVNGNLAFACYGRKTISEIRILSQGYKDPGYEYYSDSFVPQQFHVVDTYYERSSLSSIIPDFRFRLPGFGSWQSLNTAAIALQTAGGRFFSKFRPG